jgi:hypothetical protein
MCLISYHIGALSDLLMRKCVVDAELETGRADDYQPFLLLIPFRIPVRHSRQFQMDILLRHCELTQLSSFSYILITGGVGFALEWNL